MCLSRIRRLTTDSAIPWNTLEKLPSRVSVFEGFKGARGNIMGLTRSPFSFRVFHLRVPVGVLMCATWCGGTLLSDVYESVCSGESPIGVIPQENSIHGIVIETYDMLRGPDAGREAFVRGEVTIGIQHCLITRKGVALEDVRRVLSHEQVRTNSNLLCVRATRD